MWRSVVAVLALCGSAQAFYPEWAIDQAFDKAYSELKIDIPEQPTLSVGARLMQHLGFAPAPQHGPSPQCCMHCVGAVTHHIMGAVVEHLKHICEETKCPFLKKKCEMAKEHPGVAYGFLLDHTHAMEKSVAYCYGRGACPHPPVGRPHCCCHGHGKGEGECNDENVDMQMEFISHMRNMDLPAAPPVVSKIMMNIASNEGEGNQTCVQCIEGTAMCVTEGAVHAIKEWCEKTECPCAKRMCEWAEEHKDIATGVLISRLRPSGWACGWCMGKGVCHMPEKPEEQKKPEANMHGVVRRGLEAW